MGQDDTTRQIQRKGSADNALIERRRIRTVPLAIVISIVISVFPAAGLWSVAMYRLGQLESNQNQNQQENKKKFEKIFDHLHRHDLAINSNSINTDAILDRLEKIDVKLGKIIEGNIRP